jgi:hypothetical protein
MTVLLDTSLKDPLHSLNLKLQSVLTFSRCKLTMMLNSSLSNKLFSYHLYLEEQAASTTVQEAKAAATTDAALDGGT